LASRPRQRLLLASSAISQLQPLNYGKSEKLFAQIALVLQQKTKKKNKKRGCGSGSVDSTHR